MEEEDGIDKYEKTHSDGNNNGDDDKNSKNNNNNNLNMIW